MWIQLTQRQHVDVEGKAKVYEAGDWLDLGKQTAVRLVLEGAAVLPEMEQEKILGAGAGIVVRGDPEPVKKLFRNLHNNTIPLTQGKLAVPYPKTLIWTAGTTLRLELIQVGFNFLDKWDLAIPLLSYDKLACNIGYEEDHDRTEAVIRDLRVPVYDTRVIFIRQSVTMDRMLDEWKRDMMATHTDERLSFLRVLYKVKPLVLALPTTWTQPRKQGSR